MNDKEKTKAQLIEELEALRARADKLGGDETRHKQALQDSEARYRSLINNVPDVIWTTDHEGHTSFITPNVEHVYGFTPEEIYASGAEVWFGRIHPDDIDMVKTAFDALIKDNKEFNVEYRIERKDGEWIWLHDKAVTSFEAEGKTYVYGVFRDITDRKQAEEKLHLMDMVVEQSYDGIAVWGRDGHLKFCNAAWANMHGYAKAEIMGKHLTMFHTEEQMERDVVPFNETVMNVGFNLCEVDHMHKDGATFPTRMTAAMLKDEGGEFKGIVGIARDITERKKAEKELRKKTQDLDERVKELKCLYGVSKLFEPDVPIDDILRKVVELLPPGWRYPEIACARIKLGDKEFTSGNFRETLWRQDADILISGEKAGSVEVFYLEEMPELDEGPFIKEERHLLDETAKQLGEIIEKRRAEDALRDSERFHRDILNDMLTFVAVLDVNGNIIFVNNTPLKVAGIELEDIKGKKLYDTFWWEYSEEARQAIKRDVERCASGETLVHEIEFKTADGSLMWIEFSMHPILDENGKVKFLIPEGRDVTERKQAEEKIEHLNAVLRAIRNVNQLIVSERDRDKLLQSVCHLMIETRGYFSTWVALFDESGKFVSAFQAGLGEDFTRAVDMMESGEIPICAREALANEGVRMVGDPKSACPACPLSASCRGEEALAIRLEHDGKVYGFASVTLPANLIGDEEERGLFAEVAGDISFALHGIEMEENRKRAEEEKKSLEAQMQHMQKLESLGVLAGGIAHDFNNILMGILGHSDLAIMDLPPESPARYNIEQVRTAAMRASDLTNQMLAYSGKGRFVVEALNVNKIIEEMVHLMEVSIAKNAVLKLNLAEGIPPIEADAAQVHQVILNLITNASDAIGKKSGVITITTGVLEADREYLTSTFLDEGLREGAYTYFEVSDTGIGMDKETIQSIFDPFFTTKFTGRGLGLAAVLGIVRGHGGAIKVYSEPGKGTTFKALFPSSDFGPALNGDKDGLHELRDWRGSGTVLVVDDDESVRTVASLILKRFGFGILTAEDGREAVEVYREHTDEIVGVLLDMTMPHMGGEETFTALRRINPKVEVILCSGYNEQDATSRFAGKGLAGFIQKPFQLEKLILKMYQVLKTKNL